MPGNRALRAAIAAATLLTVASTAWAERATEFKRLPNMELLDLEPRSADTETEVYRKRYAPIAELWGLPSPSTTEGILPDPGDGKVVPLVVMGW